MKYYSTKSGKEDPSNYVPFDQAIFLGPAADGGLFMPESFPILSESYISGLAERSIEDIGCEIIRPFTELTQSTVKDIVSRSFTFPAPVHYVSDNIGFLELFHGPTLAFKDFGARFMAQTMSVLKPKDTQINILVATSGDIGGAVASAFSGLEGFNVYILFPKGKVSPIQQRQLTTWDDNVLAIEVDGTFDDCQRLVKQAFADKDLRNRKVFGSANSINIARLLPQMVYYFEAYKQARSQKDLTLIVPSGNFGNLTAGLFAKRIGLRIAHFIAATNINDIVPTYLRTGSYMPLVSRETLSNAMDVGDPSNFVRMKELYLGLDERSTWNYLRQDISEHVVDDTRTLDNIKEVYEKYGYIMDPHTAVAYDATKTYQGNNIIVSTAHWAKFAPTIERAIGFLPDMPEELTKLMKLKERVKRIGTGYRELVGLIG